jgi:hypothetical protein
VISLTAAGLETIARIGLMNGEDGQHDALASGGERVASRGRPQDAYAVAAAASPVVI